jgi:hypothetical protein
VAKHTSLHVGTMKAWGGSAHVATQEGGNPTGLKFDSTSNFNITVSIGSACQMRSLTDAGFARVHSPLSAGSVIDKPLDVLALSSLASR